MALPFKIKLYASIFYYSRATYLGAHHGKWLCLVFHWQCGPCRYYKQTNLKNINRSWFLLRNLVLSCYWGAGGGGYIIFFWELASIKEESCISRLQMEGLGTLAGGGQFSNSSANEPTAGKLVTHLRDLLLGSGYLFTTSCSPYLRAWLGTNCSIPRWPPLSPISRPKKSPLLRLWGCDAFCPLLS